MKYYYTDPLKAAWMAQEHNLIVSIKDNIVVSWQAILRLAIKTAANDYELRYYVSPHCHEMLKPQEDDLCCFGGDEFYIFDGYGYSNVITEIIKRNGKAFFMPEIE